MTTMIYNNQILLIISSKFDYAELIDNHYFGIYGKNKEKVSSHLITPFNIFSCENPSRVAMQLFGEKNTSNTIYILEISLKQLWKYKKEYTHVSLIALKYLRTYDMMKLTKVEDRWN